MNKKNHFPFIIFLFLLLSFFLVGCKKTKVDEEAVAKIETVARGLFAGQDLKNVSDDLSLPTYVDEVLITWTSDNPEIMAHDGTIGIVKTEKIFTLTARMTYHDTTVNKYFAVMVKPKVNNGDEENPETLVNLVATNLLSGVDLFNVENNLLLPTEISQVAIVWESSNTQVVYNKGTVFRNRDDQTATLTAHLTYKNYQKQVSFSLIVKKMTFELDPYYRGAEGLTKTALKNFLHDLIDDHQEYSYSFAKTALQKTDEDPNNPNNIILFYTGRSQAKTTYNSGNDGWNREHVWAKSHGGFGDNPPAGTDLHHLRPTDMTVNSIRGNLDFDNGGKKIDETYGAGSSFCYYDNDSFEPRDQVKGDVARILFYMAVRYDGSDGVADLELNDFTGNGSVPFMGKLSTLLVWNNLDPVDDFERNRNEVIFGYQKNRNPFIDYPHFADLIWGTNSVFTSNYNNGEAVIIQLFVIDWLDFKKQKYC